MIRPALAWTAASLASAVLGASLFIALVMGRADPRRAVDRADRRRRSGADPDPSCPSPEPTAPDRRHGRRRARRTGHPAWGAGLYLHPDGGGMGAARVRRGAAHPTGRRGGGGVCVLAAGAAGLGLGDRMTWPARSCRFAAEPTLASPRRERWNYRHLCQLTDRTRCGSFLDIRALVRSVSRSPKVLTCSCRRRGSHGSDGYGFPDSARA
jgi:hypothetical protein